MREGILARSGSLGNSGTDNVFGFFLPLVAVDEAHHFRQEGEPCVVLGAVVSGAGVPAAVPLACQREDPVHHPAGVVPGVDLKRVLEWHEGVGSAVEDRDRGIGRRVPWPSVACLTGRVVRGG